MSVQQFYLKQLRQPNFAEFALVRTSRSDSTKLAEEFQKTL